MLLVKYNKIRGKYLVDVNYRHDCNKHFNTSCSNGKGESVHLGVYDTPEEAFRVYKTYKEALIKQKAEKYKHVISPEAYNALMNYKVLITD